MRQPRKPIVAIVSDAIYPYHKGGKEVRYHELTRRMSARAEVHVYTMRWWDGPSVLVRDAITFHAITPLLDMYNDGRRSLRQAILFAFACLRLLFCRFDILEADQIPYFQILVLRIVATCRRKPFVATWHEVWGKNYWMNYFGPLGWAAWLIERIAIRLPDRILAASPETGQRLSKILKSTTRICTAPNGIDFDLVRSVQSDVAVTDLVVVGRLMAHKRLDMLLRAIAILHERGIEVTCRVIGDGPERTRLHELSTSLRLRQSIDFRHNVNSQSELFSLLKAAKIFTFPSSREGFGIAVLEALACGLPVITTSTADNLAQHLVARSERSAICDPSATAVADAVEHMLGNLQMDWKCADAFEESPWLADYSWEATANRVFEAIGI